MGDNISQEPLQNEVAVNVGLAKALRLIGTDLLGNPLLLDALGWERRYDYTGRTDGQPIYIGFANPGTATTTSAWLMQKYTFTTIRPGVEMVSRIQVIIGVWDDRTTTTFP